MLIETEDETSNKPTANVRGFFSGLAKATIFRNDDALWLSFAVAVSIRDHNEGFGVGGVGTGVLYVRKDPKDPGRYVDRGAAKRDRNPGWRRDLPTRGVGNVKDVRPQLANKFATGFSTRRPCMGNGSSSSSSSWVSREGVVCECQIDSGARRSQCITGRTEVSANTSVARDTQHCSPLPLLPRWRISSISRVDPFILVE
jgi:hypothetical protein